LQPVRDILAELKNVLDHIGSPDRLNDHPWTKSLVVCQRLADDPALQKRKPGYQLLGALSALFRETMPSVPPKRGKRLDTKWGQFGILTALYFAPFEFNTMPPSSLADAWGRIDQVIPLFVYGKPDHEIPEAELARYRLIADEEDVAPTSTLSDWHVKGLERLASLFVSREQYLTDQLATPSALLSSNGGHVTQQTTSHTLLSNAEKFYRLHTRQIWITLALIATLFLGWKTWRVYQLTSAVQNEMSQLQALADSPPDLNSLSSIAPLLTATRRDVLALQSETKPFLWMSPLVAWLPVYGGDLANADSLLRFASGTVVAADETYNSLLPLWQEAQNKETRPSTSTLLAYLTAARPRLTTARDSLEAAIVARAEIDASQLSTKNRSRLLKADPYLPFLRDALDAGIAAPGLLGADGPRTYLVMIQNEDELRATGGFLSAVAVVTVSGGEILRFKAEDSYAIDDLTKPYLYAPDPLRRYMAAHIGLLRDANWSPDFPTSAREVEALYIYTRAGPIDGVIAIDQMAVRLLLEAIGPISSTNSTDVVTADNLITYMRAAYSPPPGQAMTSEWWGQRKNFIGELSGSIMTKVKTSSAASLLTLGRATIRALDTRHISIQLDDPTITKVLTRRGWDGAVRGTSGDYLFVVNSNIGFNKVNAAVKTSLDYRVNLSNPSSPTASLRITHQNPSTDKQAQCRHAPDYGSGQYADLIARCYWDYLRLYVPKDARLINATPHEVPAEWMLLKQSVPAQVDTLEQINGAQGYGTLLVVPNGQTVETTFDFALPASALTSDGKTFTYHLYVQKQAGTNSTPFNLTIELPNGAEVLNAPLSWKVDGNTLQAAISLDEDTAFKLTFQRR